MLTPPTWNPWTSPYYWWYVMGVHVENMTTLNWCNCPLCLQERAMQAAFYRE